MVAATVQHNLHMVACGCGKVHTAPRPQGVSRVPVSLGINLRAWCVYLMVAHAIPVHRCVELIASLTGARPSPGFVHGMIARAAAKGDDPCVYRLIVSSPCCCRG
jgi:transposase